MTTISQTLRHDHVRCDSLLDQADECVVQLRWPLAATLLRDFDAALQRHFRMEEEVLFAAFEQATGAYAGPTVVMRNEHRQMRALLADLAAAAAATDADAWQGASETLRILLSQHNMKEEGILYPMCDRALGNIAAELLDAMNTLDHPGNPDQGEQAA